MAANGMELESTEMELDGWQLNDAARAAAAAAPAADGGDDCGRVHV